MKHILNSAFITGAFKHEGISYPANWLDLSTPGERAAIGIIDVPNPEQPGDYSHDLYELVEDAATPPYVSYRRRTDDEIDAIRRARVPAAVTMRQARLALLAAGNLSGVEAAIEALPSPQREAARIEWEYSQEVQRRNGFVEQLAPALGLDDAQLDALFTQAATL